MKTSAVILAGTCVVFGVAALAWINASDDHSEHQTVQRLSDGVEITIPTLTEVAKIGEVVFSENCSMCHGANAVGTDQGPPLVHIIYEPGHHNDGSFYRAVAQGVRGHHWRFGNMPPIEGVGEEDVTKIIAYVRELQRANGIN